MDRLDQILRRSRQLKSVDQCHLFDRTPAIFRDRVVAVDLYKLAGGTFRISEVILTETFHNPLGMDDYFLLSLLVNSGKENSLEVDQGTGHYQRPNQPGRMVLLQTQALEKCQGTGPLHTVMLTMKRTALEARLQDLSGSGAAALDPLLARSFYDDGLELMLKRLLAQHQRSLGAVDPDDTSEFLDGICLQLLSLTGHRHVRVAESDRLRPLAIQRVVDYIETHLGGELTRSQLATIAGVSECHFSRLFTQSVGVSVKQFVLRRRVEQAKSLLRQFASQELPLSQVAAQVGFCHKSRFCEEFRRQVGVSPEVYRSNS
ncbi:helix-turn-helix domain-containing protein [Planctomicrobium piriforme]|uniref:AraC-type DNA-binding protein n=1 Tax=Planctomicrobium piriforme TaxID=1576369 RepID=A0A1I3B5D9_9PLAN|nr:AraC family transcriptional regulator [Planctomicrobium piriforme]SFH57525.1 AraC-type DNA-binding protein [Planctomicrobium piriforme]